jgi:hypothetical protein
MSMTVQDIFLTLLVLLPLSSCEKNGFCEDDELSLSRTEYNGSDLQIDGYYYEQTSNEEPFSDIYYFYRNGVLLGGGVAAAADVNDDEYIPPVNLNLIRNTKAVWGVFKLNGNLVEIERWQSRINGCETTIYERGNILNDTTFVINRREFRSDGEVRRTDDLNAFFKFRPLTEKPDSTNSFIP